MFLQQLIQIIHVQVAAIPSEAPPVTGPVRPAFRGIHKGQQHFVHRTPHTRLDFVARLVSLHLVCTFTQLLVKLLFPHAS